MIRMLQQNNETAYNDTLCAKFSQDGTVCLQCAYRAYFDPISDMCEKVDDLCATWDLRNGQCISCYTGYGDAEYNGMAING